MSDVFGGPLNEDGVLDEQVVVDALLNSEFGTNLVGESSGGEGQSGVLVVHLSEEGT